MLFMETISYLKDRVCLIYCFNTEFNARLVIVLPPPHFFLILRVVFLSVVSYLLTIMIIIMIIIIIIIIIIFINPYHRFENIVNLFSLYFISTHKKYGMITERDITHNYQINSI
jgi:hypothetical protein